jgi:hypothetical protein
MEYREWAQLVTNSITICRGPVLVGRIFLSTSLGAEIGVRCKLHTWPMVYGHIESTPIFIVYESSKAESLLIFKLVNNDNVPYPL